MAKRNKPPHWQEGSETLDVVVPADKTASGEEETIQLRLNWKVVATRPMKAGDWMRWETERARELLALAAAGLDENDESFFRHERGLRNALTHAVRAWCMTHLRCKDARTDDDSYRQAFDEKAPRRLIAAVMLAFAAVNERYLGSQAFSTSDVVVAMQDAIEAILDAASRPPRHRRRFPARLRTGRPLRKPRVRPGSWIDTGRYRPALVVKMMPDPPHIMKLSYGDEVDDDFRPHITNWKSIRRPKRLRSLKDVYAAGDWIRNTRSGFGRVLDVRNSTMEVEYRRHTAKLAPGADLSRLRKVERPDPEDLRPLKERFPPGTWIEQNVFGRGVVLGSNEQSVNVFFSYRLLRLGGVAEGPVIWKLDKRPLDLSTPWGRRWAWWWQHEDIFGEPACPCCGYPNLGPGGANWFAAKECIVCGYPDFGAGIEDDNEPSVFWAMGCWRHRNAWDFPDFPEPGEIDFSPPEPSDQEWKISGYSLAEARRNYARLGVMFRPGTSTALTKGLVPQLRRSLVRTLDKAMLVPSQWSDHDRLDAIRFMNEILSEIAKSDAH